MKTSPIGRLVGGRYRLVSLLGTGGMGHVYRAVHTEMGKDFAVKLLRPEVPASAEASLRFAREAEAASRLSHPGCVRVTDFGDDKGTLFLVMEPLVGPTLADVLDRTPRLPPARAIHIARQILEAVGHAHALGIIHRDLKPENVVLVDRDGDPDAVKICDFGLARVLEPQGGALTDAGTVFGTPEYLSPEQALGEPADGRADLYAVGVILYEMLAGRRPFAGTTKNELLAAHLTREPPPILDISSELNAVVLRALAKRKTDRWQTAEALSTALSTADTTTSAPPIAESTPAVSSTIPLDARTPSPGSRAPSPSPSPSPGHEIRRLWPIAAAAAALLVIVIIILATAPGSSTPSTPDPAVAEPDLDAIRARLRRGDIPSARAAAERLAHDHPDEPRVFMLLGDTLFLQRETERGLAAYREAVRMDPLRAGAHAELLANLRATFDDGKHGETAFAIAEELGPAALATVEDFAARVGTAALRRRAEIAAARIKTRKEAVKR